MIYQEFKETVIGIAQEMGIADYELYYTEGDSVSVEIYQEEVKGYSVEDDLGVCFRCVVDGKVGYASTENLTEEEARSLVVRALDNAESIESEEEVFLHEKGDTYAVCPQDTSVRPTGGELIEGALALQRKMYQADPRGADGTQAVMLYGRQKYALCNSKGLDLEDVISLARCYGMPLVSEGGEMYDGFESKKGRLQDFDLDAVAEKAVEHAVSAIGADSVPSGKYDVVFSNKTMAALLQTYASVFSAEQAQKGMSLLKGKEGERIAAPFITIVDDPRYEENYVMRTFDGEGVATYAKNVVEDGVLVTLLHNLKTAAKAGVKSTGNASKSSYDAVVGVSPFTFYIKAEGAPETLGAESRKGLEDMLASAGEGLYITELMGLHAGANPITGDFSLSAKGFMISEGRKGAPVKNFTVSGNFFTVLREIEKVGSDLEFGNGSFGSPSVLVRDMSIGGKE